jgi:5-methylcytosine-specific restriction endonuclease McrA
MQPLEGFCDIDLAKDGYADMTFSPDTDAPLPQLGVRLKNANDRWTMMRYQPKLPYVDSVATWHLRYSVQIKREVEAVVIDTATPEGLQP